MVTHNSESDLPLVYYLCTCRAPNKGVSTQSKDIFSYLFTYLSNVFVFLGGKKPAQKAKEKAPPPPRAYYESCTEPSSGSDEEDDHVRDPDFNNSSVLQDLHGNSKFSP